jgi:hypothetical protein
VGTNRPRAKPATSGSSGESSGAEANPALRPAGPRNGWKHQRGSCEEVKYEVRAWGRMS